MHISYWYDLRRNHVQVTKYLLDLLPHYFDLLVVKTNLVPSRLVSALKVIACDHEDLIHSSLNLRKYLEVFLDELFYEYIVPCSFGDRMDDTTATIRGLSAKEIRSKTQSILS